MCSSMYMLVSAIIVAVSWAPLLCEGKFTVYRYSHTEDNNCLQDNLIYGNGIYDEVTMSCEVAAKSRLLFIDSGLVLGDYDEDRQCAFTDKANELVVLQGYTKNCYRRRTSGDQVTAQIMELNECMAAKIKIRNILDSKETTTTTGRQAKEQGNYEFLFADRIFHVNGICKMEIEMKSTDIKESVEMSCAMATKLNLLYIPHGFIFGDYLTNQICVFAESIDTLIVIAGKEVQGKEQPCEMKTYAAGKLTSESQMDDRDCFDIKTKIRTYWDEKKGKVIRINSRY